MKRVLLFISGLVLSGTVSAQIYSAVDSAQFSTWTVNDLDNDGNNWMGYNYGEDELGLFDNTSGFISHSIDQETYDSLTPNNLAVSPVVDCSSNSSVYLNWRCGSPSALYFLEHYAVYVVRQSELAGLATGTFPTPVYETTLDTGGVVYTKSIDVSAIAGSHSDIHIVLRHFNSTYEESLAFLEIELSTTAVEEWVEEYQEASLNYLASLKAKAYPNPTENELNILFNQNVEYVSIHSHDGKMITRKPILGNETKINVSELKNGVYFYEAVTVNGVLIRNKFVKK